jgi:FtsP/CotA-like multicopper oxidase with cupredoxin domain
LVSVDGVVPGVPTLDSTQPAGHPAAKKIAALLLMPASRAEIFVSNDSGDPSERQLVLRTDGKDTSAPNKPGAGDPWPQINLAEIILEGAPVAVASGAPIGLNQSVAKAGPPAAAVLREGVAPSLPQGCVRDIDRANLEHRRIQFAGSGQYTIGADIMQSPDKSKLQNWRAFTTDPNASTGLHVFDDYLKPDDTLDWDATDGRPAHACVHLGNGHGQLWELRNRTDELHNFHIHQTKFRLATAKDLSDYGIDPNSVTLQSGFQIKASSASPSGDVDLWNDTLPVPTGASTFIVINFDAEEQLGRYVYHCHILEHEDKGLMAPVEVIR